MNPYTGIEIHSLETATSDNRFFLIYGNRHFEANRAVVELLQILQQNQNEEFAINKYSQLCENRYSISQIKDFITSKLHPIIENEIAQKKRFLYNRELLQSNYYLLSILKKFDVLKYISHSNTASLTILRGNYFVTL